MFQSFFEELEFVVRVSVVDFTEVDPDYGAALDVSSAYVDYSIF
jgi:hypothetical protein